MSSTLRPSLVKELKPRITVIGIGGAGGNAINNMIASGIDGVEFIAANTDAQALVSSSAERRIQLGANLTEGLGAGARPEIGEAAAQEALEEIRAAIDGSHMVFIAAGMGGGTGTGAASVVAKISKEMGILTVAIVTKPFNFEGNKRLRIAEAGIETLRGQVDTLIVIPNQNLFRIANERTTFAEAFVLADQVLHSGIACITDLIVREGLINLDFADVRAVMSGMGTAMMGTGEAAGDHRALEAAELAILNPLLDDVSLRGARGLLVSISGNRSLTLYEVDEAASRVRKEVDPDANVIIGATFDESLGDKVRVSIVASGLQIEESDARYHAPRPAAAPKPTLSGGRDREPVPQLQAAVTPYDWQPARAGAGAPGPSPEEFAERIAAEQGWQGQPDEAYEQSGSRPGPALEPDWTSPNDVVIELGAPQTARYSPAWDDSAANQPVADQQAPQFRPQPPIEGRRPQRRLPEVEDFPPFAQQAYHSRRDQAQTKPAAAATERKRGGFFNFLTGRRDATPEPAESLAQVRGSQRGVKATAGGEIKADDSGRPGFSSEPSDPQQRRIPMPRHRPRQA